MTRADENVRDGWRTAPVISLDVSKRPVEKASLVRVFYDLADRLMTVDPASSEGQRLAEELHELAFSSGQGGDLVAAIERAEAYLRRAGGGVAKDSEGA